jgi:hypothetical protein
MRQWRRATCSPRLPAAQVPEAQRRAILFVEEAVLDFRGVRMERGEKGEPTLVRPQPPLGCQPGQSGGSARA